MDKEAERVAHMKRVQNELADIVDRNESQAITRKRIEFLSNAHDRKLYKSKDRNKKSM